MTVPEAVQAAWAGPAAVQGALLMFSPGMCLSDKGLGHRSQCRLAQRRGTSQPGSQAWLSLRPCKPLGPGPLLYKICLKAPENAVCLVCGSAVWSLSVGSQGRDADWPSCNAVAHRIVCSSWRGVPVPAWPAPAAELGWSRLCWHHTLQGTVAAGCTAQLGKGAPGCLGGWHKDAENTQDQAVCRSICCWCLPGKRALPCSLSYMPRHLMPRLWCADRTCACAQQYKRTRLDPHN